MAFQPVPTYQDPVEVDPKTGKSSFSPTWLSWFLTLTNGGLSSAIQHNQLLGLQGGTSGQYYHLTSAEKNSINFRSTNPIIVVPPGVSPWTFQNTNTYDVSIVVQGGTVSAISYSRDGITFVPLGVVAGMLWVSKADYLKVVYTVAPTVSEIPR